MYFKIRGSVPILVYELVRCPVRFGMSPETLSIFIYPTGRFYHTLRIANIPLTAGYHGRCLRFPVNIYFFDINLLRTYNHSITTLAKQQDFLLFVVTGT